MGAVILIIAGGIFFINALFLYGMLEGKSVGFSNYAFGAILGALTLYVGFTAGNNLGALLTTAMVFLFVLFYIKLGGVLVQGQDGKALGWFCLYATIFVLLCAYYYFAITPDVRFAIFSLSWALLFFVSFLTLGLGKAYGKVVATILLVEAFVTLQIPGFLMLAGKW